MKKMNIKNLTKFKKIFLAIIAFILLSSIFSELNLQNKSFAEEPESKTSTSSTNSNELKLINPGHLTIAVSPPYPPFIELQGNDLVGFEPDLYKEIGKDLGLEIEEKILNFDAIIAAVSSGTQCDCAMSGITINAERQKVVDFSEPYYISDLRFVVSETCDISLACSPI